MKRTYIILAIAFIIFIVTIIFFLSEKTPDYVTDEFIMPEALEEETIEEEFVEDVESVQPKEQETSREKIVISEEETAEIISDLPASPEVTEKERRLEEEMQRAMAEAERQRLMEQAERQRKEEQMERASKEDERQRLMERLERERMQEEKRQSEESRQEAEEMQDDMTNIDMPSSQQQEVTGDIAPPAPSPPPPPSPPKNGPDEDIGGVADRGSVLTARGTRSEGIKSVDQDELETALQENEFVKTSDWDTPTNYPSTSIDSYDLLEGALWAGYLPDSSEIQINELINAFEYTFADSGENIELLAYLHRCPWASDHFLLMIGARVSDVLDSEMIESPNWSITLSVDMIDSYRLLGQEEYYTEIEVESVSTMMIGESVVTMYELIPNDINSKVIEASFQYSLGWELKEANLQVKHAQEDPNVDFVLAHQLIFHF